MASIDPEDALRKRLMGQVDPTGDPTAPLPAAQFNAMDPTDGGDGSYTPPDPSPFVPTVQPERVPDAPAPAAPAPAAAPTYAQVQGFDAAKMADPNYSSAKYTPAAREFAAAQGAGTAIGRNNLDPMVAHAQANGFPNARVVGDDKIDYGDGNGPIDVIQSNGSVWFQNGQDRFAKPGAGAGGAAAGGAQFNGAAGAAGAAGGAPAQSDFMNQLRATLLKQIAQAQTPVDENALQITAPLSAARDEVSRSSDAERKALAEHAYATGDLHSSTLGQQMQQSAERNAGGLSQLRAGLISNEYKQKRDELQSYLQLAVASGDAELARQVQMEMAQLNASVNREGQGINLAEFTAQLNQQAALAGLKG